LKEVKAQLQEERHKREEMASQFEIINCCKKYVIATTLVVPVS
jgi:hypothetical protein